MALTDTVRNVRYLTDESGERTDVLIPMATWKALLASWEQLRGAIEDQEDRTVLREWLTQRATGVDDSVSLDELERELIADGLLPG